MKTSPPRPFMRPAGNGAPTTPVPDRRALKALGCAGVALVALLLFAALFALLDELLTGAKGLLFVLVLVLCGGVFVAAYQLQPWRR